MIEATLTEEQRRETLRAFGFLVGVICDANPIDGLIARRRIIDRRTWAEIAPEVGLSVQETQRRWKHVLGKLRVELGSDGDK